jgi:hypothetical protein
VNTGFYLDFWTREDTGDRINGRRNKPPGTVNLIIGADSE